MKLHVGTHTHTHTWIVDHWNHHSVYRDCSFPGSIVLGVWGFSWFHSIRYKIKKKKKKKITFSKIFANRKQKKFNLYLTRTRVFLSNNVKKIRSRWHLSFQKNRFERTITFSRSWFFFTSSCFCCYRCKISSKFLQQELSIFYFFFSRIWTSNIN